MLTMKQLPGEIKLLDSRQVECERIEVRSIMFPQKLILKASVLSLMMGEDPIKNQAFHFVRYACDHGGKEEIIWMDSEECAKKGMEAGYECLLKLFAEKTAEHTAPTEEDAQILLLFM